MGETFRSPLRLVLEETRIQLRLLRRNPVSVLFTVALPLLLLPLLDALQGDVLVQLPAAAPAGDQGPFGFLDGRAPWMQYATPAIAAFAVVSACFANLAIRTAVARETGVLKRVRATPLPPAIHLAGRLCSNATVALLVATVAITAGVGFYEVELEADQIPALAGLVILGSLVFSALGLATTAIIPNSDAAPAVVYALLFPLAFVSNVFYPPELAPQWMETTAATLPLGPFVSAMVGAMTPTAIGSGVILGELAALAGWGVLGATVALATFRWVPNRERTTALRSQRRRSLTVVAVPAGIVVAVVGVLVPEVRPTEAEVVGTVAQLEATGVITKEIFVESSRIEMAGPVNDIGVVPIEIQTQIPFQVSVVDRGDGPEAFGFEGCGVESTAGVDPEWLAGIAPGVSGGAWVQPCRGAVYAGDFTCLAGPCVGPLVMPTSVDDGAIEVAVEGTMLQPDGRAAVTPPVSPASYTGTLLVGDDPAGSSAATFTLVSDANGIAFVDPLGGWEIRFVTSSPWLGTIAGLDVLGPPARAEPVTTVFTAEPLGFAMLPPGDERSNEEAGTRFSTSRPDAGQRILTFSPVDDKAPLTPRGFVRLGTTGDLFDWSAVEIDLQVDGSPRVFLDLVRAR